MRYHEKFSMKAARTTAALTFIFHAAGIALIAASIATEYWIVEDGARCSVFVGDDNLCLETLKNQTSWAFKEPQLLISKVFLGAGAGVSGAGLFAYFAWFALIAKFWKGRRAALAATSLSLVGGCLSMIGVVMSLDTALAGYSAWVGLAGALLLLVNSILAMNVAGCLAYYFIPSGVASFNMDDETPNMGPPAVPYRPASTGHSNRAYEISHF